MHKSDQMRMNGVTFIARRRLARDFRTVKVRVMNIKNLGLPLVVFTFLALAGCSTQTVVTLQNGTQYLTKDAPKTKTVDGFYEFTDIAGKHVRVKADDVATVIQEK